MLYRVHLVMSGLELAILVVIGTDRIGGGIGNWISIQKYILFTFCQIVLDSML